VKDPLQLAEHLAEDAQWTRAAIDAQVKSGKTETVYLAKPIPVYLLYWTAEVTPDGALRFHSDVYARDRPLLAALNQAPVLRKKSRRGDP